MWGRSAAHFSQQTQRVHGADYVVADVCRECNSTRLSHLDAYFCRLHREYFAETRGFEAAVSFAYDFHLFVRALLKIAYNSARGAGSQLTALLPYRRYIAGLEALQDPLAVFAELVSPAVRHSKDPPHDPVIIPPTMYRSAVTQVLTPRGDRLHTRFVAVNSFYFHLVLPARAMTPDAFRKAAMEVPEFVAGLVELSEETGEVVIRSSPQDGLSGIEPMLRRHASQYGEFFKRRNKGS